MSWQPTAFQFPPSAAVLSDAVTQTVSDGAAEINNALSRLSTVQPSVVKNPIAATATNTASVEAAFSALFHVDCRMLVVHPYIEGVGQGEGVHRHLSGPNAQRALATKLCDTWDLQTPAGAVEAVVLLLAEKTLAAFADRLALFTAVVPIPAFQLAQRRAAQLLALESQKSVLPGAPLGGTWHPQNVLQQATVRTASMLLGKEIAVSHGYDRENIDPNIELQALAEKKQAHMTAIQATLEAFAATLPNAGPTQGFFSSGDPRAIADALLSEEPLGHDYVLTAGVVFVAEPGKLTFLKEWLGQ